MRMLKEAILNFAMGEKIKTLLICLIETGKLLNPPDPGERKGAVAVFKLQLNLAAREIHLAGVFSKASSWRECEKHMDMAIVMAESGVPEESAFHLAQALSQVTTVLNQSMKFLKSEHLI